MSFCGFYLPTSFFWTLGSWNILFFVAFCDEVLLTFYFVIVPLSSADPGCDCFQSGLYAFSAFCPPLGVAIESRCWDRSSGLISEQLEQQILQIFLLSLLMQSVLDMSLQCVALLHIFFLFLNWIVFHFSVGPSSRLKSRETEEFSGLHLTRINIKDNISIPMIEPWCSCFTLDIGTVTKKIRGRSISVCLSPSSGEERLTASVARKGWRNEALGFSFTWWESILFHWERPKQNKIT